MAFKVHEARQEHFTDVASLQCEYTLIYAYQVKACCGEGVGRGGESKDVSEIGVEFSNSMAGGHAVRLAYFVYRLICANGLISKVAGDGGRLVHSGNEQRFRKRLYDKASSVLSDIEQAKKMIETLGSLAFDSNPMGGFPL